MSLVDDIIQEAMRAAFGPSPETPADFANRIAGEIKSREDKLRAMISIIAERAADAEVSRDEAFEQIAEAFDRLHELEAEREARESTAA